MLDIWFEGISVSREDYKSYQIGSTLLINKGRIPDLMGVSMAIIGVDGGEMNPIRQQLYSLKHPAPNLKIADLGNLKKSDLSFIIPVIKELLDSKILPIIISGDPMIQLAQYKAFQGNQQAASLVLVDDRIRLEPKGKITPEDGFYLNEALFNKNSRLFHLSCIGYQNQYVSPEIIDFLEHHHFDHLRLGMARKDLSEVEPLIRDGDIMSIHLASMKQIECPFITEISPSGFFTEEICQISRYAGLSDKMKSFGIYGFDSLRDSNRSGAECIAQIIWYFMEGVGSRFRDFPVSTDGLMEYIVELKKLDYQLTFWKSNKSGRWWLQVPVKTKKQLDRHRLIPCSYQDYQLACRDELPDRLIHALRRF
jgi:formiminoglutamase